MPRFSLPCALVLTLALPGTAAAQVVTFENPTLSQQLAGPNTYQNGATLNPPGSFTTAGAAFNNSYDPTYGSWSGWSYSNVTNTTTAGYGNQYAAYSLAAGGAGDASANYAVAYQGSPTVALPAGARPSSARVTNTTYAALSMLTGDSFAKKFGGATGTDPDFFLLTVTGRNAAGAATGAVPFYLADYRYVNSAQDYVVKDWTTVDLSSLSPDTTSLAFTLMSSDAGLYGINTPTYFALDNLALTPVPEPVALVLAAASAIGGWRAVRGRAWIRRGGRVNSPVDGPAPAPVNPA